MFRFLRRTLLLLVLAALAGAGVALWQSRDPRYALQAWLAGSSFWQFDELIETAGRKYGVEPRLIKALVWRESRFSPEKVGTSGERGLMQVTEAAAREWARAEKIETFVPTDLFDPQNNLFAGTWYFGKALERWKAQDDPVPFALAEYNAGRSRVERWVTAARRSGPPTAAEFLRAIDFPGTRQYIEDVMERGHFYERMEQKVKERRESGVD